MKLVEIANEVLDEYLETHDLDNLGTVEYYQSITDVAHFAFEKWDLAIFVAFEDIINQQMLNRGIAPNESMRKKFFDESN